MNAWATSNLRAPVTHISGLLLRYSGRQRSYFEHDQQNLERVAYFASYVAFEVDAEKRDQIIADLRSYAAAAKIAIEASLRKNLLAEDTAQMQNPTPHATVRMQGGRKPAGRDTSLLRAKPGQHDAARTHEPETDYRAVSPDDLRQPIKAGAWWITAIVSERPDLEALISELEKEVEEAKGQRKEEDYEVPSNASKACPCWHFQAAGMCISVFASYSSGSSPNGSESTGGRFANQ